MQRGAQQAEVAPSELGTRTSELDAGDALSNLAATSGMRRVVILLWRDVADPEAGGSEMHADHIAREWAAAGMSVTMRTSAAPGEPELERRGGYTVIRRSSRERVFVASVRDQLLGRLGPTDGVLEVWNGVPYFSPLWSRQPSATFIHHVHRDMWELTLSPRLASFGRVLEHRLAPPFYKRARVVTPSETAKQEIVDYLRLPAAKITVAEPGVDPMFSPGGGRSVVPTILTVGRLVPYKAVDQLVQMMPGIRKRIPEARLVVIGEGYQRPAIEQAIDRLGARDFVELRGRVSDAELVSAYREAWVLTSASIAEGWGLTITEAAACGMPAVVSKVGGHCDAVTDDVTGWLAPSPAHLAEGLVRVLSDEVTRARLGEGAQKAAAGRTWTATALTILRALVDASEDRRGHRVRCDQP